MNLLRRIDQILLFLEKIVLQVSIISSSVMLITNVIARKVFNHSLTFNEEIGGFFILASTFIGIGYGARMGRHIRMSAVFDLLPSRLQKITILSLMVSPRLSCFCSHTMHTATFSRSRNWAL